MSSDKIRQQIMDSAGLREAPATQTSATKNSSNAKAVESLAEVTSTSPEDHKVHFAENLIASDEAPRREGSDVPWMKKSRPKSMVLAVVLVLLFGPFGLFYVSWKRALLLLLLFIVGVSLIPKNRFVVLLLWLVVPILSILLLGVGQRQPPLT